MAGKKKDMGERLAPDTEGLNVREKHSVRQMAFLEEYCSNGWDRSAAYDKVYGDEGLKYSSKAQKMYNLINNAKAQIYIKQRQQDLRRKVDITRLSQIAFLEDIKQKCKFNKPIAAIDAVRVQNQMLGWDKPESITEEISVTQSADREFKVTIVLPKENPEKL